MKNFKPIKKTTVCEEIIRQIISMVRAGSLKQGDKLPSERKLGELLGVGRSSVREALRALEAGGLIRRTTGGTILYELGRNGRPALWLSAIDTKIQEVFETRKLMEIELCGLAAKRATPEDIKKIREAIGEEDEIEQLTVYGTAFHRAVVAAARNSVFSTAYQMVTGLLFQNHKYYNLLEKNKGSRFMRKTLEQHKKILMAIESHDVVSAKKSIADHLTYVEENLLGKVQ